MRITEFGRIVRKSRLYIGVSLKEMADTLGVSSAFLSGLETGRKKIPSIWTENISKYFKDHGLDIGDQLAKYADIANESVDIKDLPFSHQLLISGFAKSNFTQKELEEIAGLMERLNNQKEK